MINWITDSIAIGEYSDACNRELLEKEEIDAILNVREKSTDDEIDTINKLNIKYVWAPVCMDVERFMYNPIFTSKKERERLDSLLIDQVKKDAKFAEEGLNYILSEYHKVLVHCTAGIDRAPFIVARYLVENKGYTYEEAYKLIKEKRPFVIEHMEWIDK